jgi:adenylate cyclase
MGTDLRTFLTEFARPGESGLSGVAIWRAGQVVLTSVILITNLIGAVTVVVISLYVVPLPANPDVANAKLINVVAAAIYIGIALPVGALVGTRRTSWLRQWLKDDRPATPDVQRVVLRTPLRLFVVQITLWLGGAVLFGALNSGYSRLTGAGIAAVVALTGVVTASCAYLFTERFMRIPAARVLATGMPDRLTVPGEATRAVLAWALGTGIPMLTLVAIGIVELTGSLGATPSRLAVAMVALGGIGIGVGLLAVSLAARATADPINSVRDALARVQHGNFDVVVPVYDGTQIGQLQIGFNQMAAGLAERERIRQVFGTYVDPAVAEYVLSEGTNLEGEEVEVTIMFIDVRNFTGFAESNPARVVVAALNHLFEHIVPIIRAQGGHVNKFIGDGVLAVFGAPGRLPHHADRALAAALEVALTVESGGGGQLRVGIGLNSGSVVAGNVGGADRFEFSIIGDAVNVASRVEAATRQTGDTILIAQRTMDLLSGDNVPLMERPALTLKGKNDPVMLYAPQIAS